MIRARVRQLSVSSLRPFALCVFCGIFGIDDIAVRQRFGTKLMFTWLFQPDRFRKSLDEGRGSRLVLVG